MRRSSIWRTPLSSKTYPSCNGFSFQGYLVPSVPEAVGEAPLYTHLDNFRFYPSCYQGKPVYSANKIIKYESLPQLYLDWQMYIGERAEGEFMYSIYPTIYSLTAATVVSCFLTVIVFTNTHKPSVFLILGSLLSSINLINILCTSVQFLSENIASGNAPGENLLDNVQLSLSFNIIDLFSVFILQLCQVQIIMRLFSRQKEKRFAFVVGVSLSLISQIIWAISTFHSMKTSSYNSYDADLDNLSIMPAFIYLLRIAMSMIYSVLICIYCFIKFEFIRQKHLILISVVSIFSTTLQFAFFVADVSNVWVAELSEIFNAAGYVVSTVIVWEWINRIHASERDKQNKGILGRPFYEEELGVNNQIDRVSLFVPDDEKMLLDSRGSDEPPVESPYKNFLRHTKKTKELTKNKSRYYIAAIPVGVKKCTTTLAYVTDQLIAYGLAVPRSVSTTSRNRIFTRNESQQEQDLDNSSGVNGPTFVYDTKNVEIDDVEENGNSVSEAEEVMVMEMSDSDVSEAAEDGNENNRE